MKTSTVIIVVVLVLAVVGFLVLRRVRYVRALKERGWTFDSNPTLAAVFHHAAPPLGLGLSREVDELVSGTTRAGVPFGVFEYAYIGAGTPFDRRVASLRLPVVLPPIFLSSGVERAGVLGGVVPEAAGLTVRTDRPEAAAALLTPAVQQALGAYGRRHGGVDLSVDGEWLVAVGAPKDPDELEVYLDSLAAVVRAVDPAALAPYAVPPPPPGFTFFGRPDWVFVDRDDSLVDLYGVDRGGHSHEAVQVVRAVNDGLRLDAFRHEWKTTHTRTVSDGRGGSRTETSTRSHDEPVLVVNLPFAFDFLNVADGWAGDKVRFESEPFNDAYPVRTRHPRFASDVIHPRTMELIMAWRPAPFTIENHQVRFAVPAHDQFVIAHCADFVHAFFALVPSFVWSNLRVDPPPFRDVG